MKSRIDGRNYAIMTDEMDKPIRINKKATDASLNKINKALTNLTDALKEVYEENLDLYELLQDRFSWIELSDSGRSWRLSDVKDECDSLIQELAENDDDVCEDEYYETLRDLGFRQDYAEKYFWEKILEDTKEKEVVEEVLFLDKPVYRKRTTIWEKTNYGRSSKDIIYEDMKINKKMKMIIENTKRIFNIEGKK